MGCYNSRVEQDPSEQLDNTQEAPDSSPESSSEKGGIISRLLQKYLDFFTSAKERKLIEEVNNHPRWADPSSFNPENVFYNFDTSRKCFDIFWSILFVINFVLAIVLFILLGPFKSGSKLDPEFQVKDIVYSGIHTVGVSFGYSVIICVFSWFFPSAFIRFAFLIVAILVLTVVIVVSFFINPVLASALTSLPLLAICLFCQGCGKFTFTVSILRLSFLILFKYPSLVVFNFILLIIQCGIGYIFTVVMISIYSKGLSLWLYIYIVLSYFWISKTVYFFTYATFSGVAAIWYFLSGTEYHPSSPFWLSFKYSITSGFGPIALAGFLEGISEGFRWIKEKAEVATCGVASCCICCCMCCCKCIACCIRFFNGKIIRQTLVYTTMFACSSKDATIRWSQIEKRKLIKYLLKSSVVALVFRFYSYSAFIVGGGLGLVLGHFFTESTWKNLTFIGLLSGTISKECVMLLSQPAEIIADTLFIGAVENPKRLKEGANECCDYFDDKFQKKFDEEMEIYEKECAKFNKQK